MKKDNINFGRADLHIHTKHSIDCLTSVERVFQMAKKRKMDIIAITDHNTIGSWAEAKVLSKKYKIEIIQGEEISTKEGHLLGLFIKKFIPPRQGAIETIKEIHKQGGLAIIPHPDYPILKSISSAMNKNIFEKVDGIELLNGGAKIFSIINKNKIKLKFLNKKILKKAVIGSSDAHLARYVGICHTSFIGKTSKDLYLSIKKRTTTSRGAAFNYRDKVFYIFHILAVPKIFYRQLKRSAWIIFENQKIYLKKLNLIVLILCLNLIFKGMEIKTRVKF